MDEDSFNNRAPRFSAMGSNFSEAFIDQYPLDSTMPYRSILTLILVSNLWTLILTTIPIVTDLPPDNYYTYTNWYTGSDIIRLLEPIGGTVLNFIIFYRSGIFKHVDHNSHSRAAVLVFLLGLGIYSQGAGFHSASCMYKSAMESFDDDLVADNDKFKDLIYYARTIWEHIVSHYLYAIGMGIMNAAQTYAYRDTKAPQLGLTKTGKALMFASSLVYGVLIGGTAINFPSGIIVLLAYVVTVGFGVMGGYIFYEYYYKRDTSVLSLGGRPVLHHFMLGYLWALIIIIAWIIAVGGIKTRTQASG